MLTKSANSFDGTAIIAICALGDNEKEYIVT